MPSRPELRPKGNRPTSAIYLGNSPIIGGPSSSKLTPTSSSPYDANVQTPPSLPDLPEPPSPESSPGSRGSGLPSPPATNSTGSGSTGDPGSIALRQRPLSLASDSSGSSHRTVSERSATRSRSVSRSSYLRDESFPDHDGGDYEDDNDDLDGDQTAKLDRRHQTSEHNLALQRVKSLTQRNRMAIDKLSRLGSPSPSVAPSATSSSRSRQSRTTLPPDYGASGSETERESTSASSSSRRPVTPPSGNHHVTVSGTPSPYRRLRQASTPESPHKVRLSAANSPSQNSPSARRRKRASMASIQSYSDEENEDENQLAPAFGRTDRTRDGTVRDIAKNALAAVASSRTPLSTRRRGALPQEFVDNADLAETRSVVSRRSDDVREHNRHSMDLVTPYRAPTRSSTLRETGRTSQAASRRLDETTAAEPSAKRERRPTLRGGSAESVLRSPGRTLLSEGLRAAGLSRREEVAAPVPTTSGDVFRDRERRAATPSRELATRAATSMASYRSDHRHRDDDGEQQPTSTRRQHRTTQSMATERDFARTGEVEHARDAPRRSAVSKHSDLPSYPSKRQSQAAVTSTEHLRLMLETLQAFEANVSKLPSGVTNSKMSSATDLLKHAQHLVHITERINALMRNGTNKALEEQIQAEVDVSESVAAEEMLDVWRLVGGEYREGLRASDDLVRALTSFLIDVGSTLRKLSPNCGETDHSTPSPHVRSLSLEEEGVRVQARSGAGSELNGRKSIDLESMSRKSQNREEALRKLGGGGTGRESSLGRAARASPALAALRDRERTFHNTPSPASTSTKPLPSLSAQTPGNPVRRLFTPSQQRERELETKLEVGTRRSSALHPSQHTIQDPEVEPSPTPASRTMDRSRALPAIPISDSPPSLSRMTPVSKAVSNSTSSSSAASASVQRSVSTRESDRQRRKPSIASIATIRGSQAPPNLTTPSTAVTSVTPTTVSHSHDVPELLRTESMHSGKSGITFSRPSTSALSGIQHQARDGHRKSSYSIGDGPQAEHEDSPAPSRGAFASRTFSKARAPPELQTNSRPRLSPRVSSTEYVSNTVRNPETPFSKGSTSHAADRHAASTMLPHRTNSMARERRRAVSDIFPQE